MAATILGIKYFLGNLPNTPFLLFICVLFGILMYIMTIWLIAPNLIQKVREIIYLSGMIPTKKSN
jgi:hypothetical protein